MYRPRVLQQGEPTGIWARIGGGKYSYSGSGIDTATDYTRIQGGYDAKISRGWTVGAVSYTHLDLSLVGDVIVKSDPNHASEINIGIDGKLSLWDGLAFNLADKDAKHPSHINVFLGDYGYWDHFYQAGLHEGNLSGSTQPSHVHKMCIRDRFHP